MKMTPILSAALMLNVIVVITCANDPCSQGSHHEFPTANIGARNEGCMSAVFEECDIYFDESLWYTSAIGKLITHCPKDRSCGTPLPAWIDGSYPSATDGVVTRTVCIKKEANCCFKTLNMEIKNCSTFAVFRLPNVPSCPSAYCFESSLPCETTTAVTSTQPGTIPPPTLPNDNRNHSFDKSESRHDYLLIGMLVGGGVVFVCITTGIVLYHKFGKKSPQVSSLPQQHVIFGMQPAIQDGLPPKKC